MSSGLVLVTGANGLVGAPVCAALRKAGWTVLPVVRKRSGADGGAEMPMDLGKVDLVDQVRERPDVIVHLAAAVTHARDYPDTEESAAVTRRIDHAVYEAARHWNAHVVYASTCGLYDRSDPTPKLESAKLHPASPYFRAKLEGETLMQGVSGRCVVRLSAVVGARLRRSVVLAKFIERARQGQPLEVWGSGRREQDFIAAADVADFIVAAVSRRLSGIFNIAAGVPTTMRALAALVVDVVGSGIVQLSGRTDPSEHDTARYSVAAARASAGWEPRVPLRTAIAGIKSMSFVD